MYLHFANAEEGINLILSDHNYYLDHVSIHVMFAADFTQRDKII